MKKTSKPYHSAQPSLSKESAQSDERTGVFITAEGQPEGGKIIGSSMLDGFNRFTHLYSFEEGNAGPGAAKVKLSDMSIRKNKKLIDIRTKLRNHSSIEPSIRVEDSNAASICGDEGTGR